MQHHDPFEKLDRNEATGPDTDSGSVAIDIQRSSLRNGQTTTQGGTPVPDDTIQLIKARVSVEELAREAGLQLRQEGSEFKSPCPFHQDTDPSFTIYPGDDGYQKFKCFGCKKGGDSIDFYREWRGVDQATALKELAARAGAEPAGAGERRPTTPKPQRRGKPDDSLAGYPPAQPKEEPVVLPGGLVPVSLAEGVLERQTATLHRHPEVLQFLQEKRRLTHEVIQRARLGYDERRQRIIIPMTGPDGTVVRSRLYDWQKRQKGAKVIWGEGDKIPRLYPFWALEHDELLLVAGEMDCLAAWSLGIPAISGTGGEEKWGRQFSRPLAGKKITICYDLDPEGQNGARLVADDLVKVAAEVRVLTLPLPWKQKGDPKDLTDWIVRGGTAEQLRELIARAPVMAKTAGADETEMEPRPVHDRLPDAPVSEEALVPDRWLVSDKGVFEVTSQNGRTQYRPVVSVPVVITERIRNLDSDVESVKIAFLRDGRWRTLAAERDTIADKGRIVRLSARGLPVTSNTSGRLVQYLADYEAANLDVIPVQLVVSISGWRFEEEVPLFLSGATMVTGQGGESPPLLFQPETDGDGNLVAPLKARGDYETWKAMVQKLMPFHRLMFCLYASCAAAMLSPCEAPNFIVDLAGDTSKGKTTALEVAASVWGLPPGHVGGLVKSWNVTKVFAERYSALFNDHPVFLDDSQTSDQRTVAGVLYMVANGIGRGRGAAKGGVQRVTHWRTVCFSTGEQPLTSNTEFGGARARVLTLWGSPFNSDNQGELVREVKGISAQHYGFLGRMVVEKLIQIRQESGWEPLRQVYQDRVQQLAKAFPGNVADRLSRYVGLVWAAADLVHHVLGLNASPEPVITRIMREVTSELEEGDYATRAMDAVRSWAHASINQFYGKEEFGRPPSQYIGTWRHVSGDTHFIGFFPTRLRDFLITQGFSPDTVIRQWRDRGWLRTQAGKTTCVVKIQGDAQRMVLIPSEVWESGTVTPE